MVMIQNGNNFAGFPSIKYKHIYWNCLVAQQKYPIMGVAIPEVFTFIELLFYSQMARFEWIP